MTVVDRRLALMGLGTASAFLVGGTVPAHSQTTPAAPPGAQTKTLGKGVRQVIYGEGSSIIPGIKTVRLRDVILDPGAKIDPNPTTPMICHMAQGELEVTRTNESFTAQPYRVWTCSTGMSEGVTNKGNTVAVMRIIDLIA
jgi:hypothetical protein